MERTRLLAAALAPCTLAVALALTLAPGDACAFVRVGAVGEVEYLSTPRPSAPSVYGIARAEVTFNLPVWFGLGAYGQYAGDFAGAGGAWGAGALVSLRPRFPVLPLAPFAYASLGYDAFALGNQQYSGGADARVGGGLSFFLGRYVDLDLRVAYAPIFAFDSQTVEHGFVGGLSLAIHP